MANSYQLIENAGILIDFDFDGDNLKTFSEGANTGFAIKKDEKAFLSVDLWKPFTKKLTDENGKPVIDAETGKQKEETLFMLKLHTCPTLVR
ncbi:hypothetical protein [Bacillus sp. Bos-x628]|uniref:hypothetical protein n=1 Tax=Bacillus maqinnsis TaxID=3229854 RepID=UPI00338E2012